MATKVPPQVIKAIADLHRFGKMEKPADMEWASWAGYLAGTMQARAITIQVFLGVKDADLQPPPDESVSVHGTDAAVLLSIGAKS